MPRRSAFVTLALALAIGLALTFVAAGAAGAKSKKPVKLSGKVNNEGVGKVKNGSVEIEADDFYFEKTFLKAKPGTVEVTVENESDTPHTFTVDSLNIDENLAPGATKTITIDVPADDAVAFYCRFHLSLGMQGALFTKSGVSAAGATSKSGGSGSNSSSSDSSGSSGSNSSSGGGYGY